MDKLDLKAMIEQYPGCTSNRAKLRATLLDCYPQAEYRREINIILAVYESGVLSKFQGKDSLTSFETSALCSQIESNYGILGEYVMEGLAAWGEAKGVKVAAVTPPKPNTAPAPVAAPKPAPPTKPTASQPPAAAPKPTPPTKQNAPQPLAAATKPMSPKPFTPVQGSVSEYVIEERKEGWFITKFQGFEQENMKIPNIIDGKHIVGIGYAVFQGCKGIKSVTISDGIRLLCAGVFRECSLEQVIFPNTLEKIDKECFYRSNLKSIIVPDGVVTIGETAFGSCHALKTVKLPDTATQIGRAVFSGSGIKSIILPRFLRTVGENMFSFCSNLSNVVLPEYCVKIESGAFQYCRNLQEIRIPPSVVFFETGPFSADSAFDKSGLKTIYCAPGSAAMEYARKHSIQCKPL